MRERVVRAARRPPGTLTGVIVALVVLVLGTGTAAALDIKQRRDLLVEVSQRGGPVTSAAVRTYQSLSDADATAAGAFLAGGGVEPAAQRERYLADIAEAASALSTAAAGAAGSDSLGAVAELTGYLPIYTGLVETARTYNRQGLPMGAAYLREASGLVRDHMLPAAKRLYETESARLAERQREAASPGLLPLILGLLTLGALVVAQYRLFRATNRRLNAGLLASTALALAGLGWFAVASLSANGHVDASRVDGAAQVRALADARIEVLGARSDEALTLVARGNGKPYEEHFQQTAGELDGLLAKAREAVSQPDTTGPVDTASKTWKYWLDRHKELRKQDDDGAYDQAVRIATGTDGDSTGVLAAAIDRELGVAIAAADRRFTDEVAAAGSDLSAADLAVLVLLLLAAGAVVVGITPRLREYR
ncbi:MAG TPA: hypothetical protein VM677_31210 [Actinokineospora sp.]|nr:hypothetical protein [Actinokineospora sp.]